MMTILRCRRHKSSLLDTLDSVNAEIQQQIWFHTITMVPLKILILTISYVLILTLNGAEGATTAAAPAESGGTAAAGDAAATTAAPTTEPPTTVKATPTPKAQKSGKFSPIHLAKNVSLCAVYTCFFFFEILLHALHVVFWE
ncbi:hypothetical protein EGW08_018055, partial [Elysia chlorotica]